MQAVFYMGEDFLVGGAEEGLVAEVARGEEAVVQAAAVADVVPAAVLAATGGDVLGASVGLGLFDAGQDVGEGLAVQVAVGVLQQVVVAEASAGHHVARRCNGHELVLAVLCEHAARRLACGDVAGYLHEVRLRHLALVVVKPHVEQLYRRLGVFVGGDAVLVHIVLHRPDISRYKRRHQIKKPTDTMKRSQLT